MSLTRIYRVLQPASAAFSGQGAYDLIDLATLKLLLNIPVTTTTYDDFLLKAITQSSGEASRFCNRVFPIETLQEQIYPPRDYFPPIAIGGVGPLQLKRWPIAGQACVAGLAAPTIPLLSTVAGGALTATRYFVVVSYVTAAGETAVSVEANLAIASNNLLVVASPKPDSFGLASGWNVYIGTKSGQETLQNASPLPIGSAFTLPTGGLVAGAQNQFVSVIENQIPLAEGIDFLVDYYSGEMTRLDVNGWPKRWPPLPIVVLYPAGYAMTDPELADAQDAVSRLVKGRYYALNRDPALRQENIEGVWSAAYWFASGPGAASGNLPPDVQALLEKYRTPVVG